nr:invertase recombinase-like protein [Archangium primigenium]
MVLLTACGDSTDPEGPPAVDQPQPDPGTPQPDAGTEVPDAGAEPPDSGTETPDAGSEVPDSGMETPDAGSEVPDSGTETPDSGTGTPDAGTGTPDSGTGTPDSGTGTPDSGTGTPDAGSDAGMSVLDNWSFEEWPDALPVQWLGSKSSLTSDAVQKVTTSPFHGLNAVRLSNATGTHKRFTTVAKSMPAGRYACTYQVRGSGEIRNGFFDTDYSSYSSYTTVETTSWTQVSYSFNLASPVYDTFEFVFSLRNTRGEHLIVDDVRCTRAPEACDAVSCESWQRCVNATATCEPLAGRCNTSAQCSEWQSCDATHTCVTAADRCVRHADCAGTPQTPVCDTASHACVEGDPCAGVVCNNPATSCNPTSGVCELSPGACFTTYDCRGELPACDPATRRCVSAEHSANIIRNGGFENWSNTPIPYYGTPYIPDYWYGLDNGVSDPGSEIKPSRLVPYTKVVHGGSRALQFVVPIQTAERFTLQKFNVPTGNYSCSYRVRGHGTIRHRIYSSAGWSPQTDFLTVDSDAWEPVFFRFTGNVRDWRLFFYPGRSVADRDHLQVDDVVCTKD